MKRMLLGSTSVLGAGLMAAPALAADGIKLSVGGFFREAYMVVIDDDGEFDFGKDRAADGFFNDAEIHFTGSTVLDNGLEVGARVELEGETDGDQIDEAWVWFAGGFGEVRIGSDDDALANACVVPPGGTTNFSAFSPNQWGANSAIDGVFGAFGSNSVCTGVDNQGDAQKIVYISPNFGGFQITASYTPNGAAESHVDGAGPHIGMPEHELFGSRHNTSVYATYSYDGDNWGLTAGLGGSWQGHVEDETEFRIEEQDFYQAGLNLTFGNFSLGAVGAFFNDAFNLESSSTHLENDVWVVGGGASYAVDAWTFGLQYSHRENEILFGPSGDVDHIDISQDRTVATVNYAFGPGIKVDAEVAYTWMDADPELDFDRDDYDAVEFGIGTAITF